MRLAPLFVCFVLGCAGRKEASDTSDASAGADAPLVSSVGRGCANDAECAGLVCAKRFERSCAGPIKPHAWSVEFLGGLCNPPLDATKGEVVGGCPAGSKSVTLATGCDGVPFRYCTTTCKSDADCRTSDGWGCDLDGQLCLPFGPPDAATD